MGRGNSGLFHGTTGSPQQIIHSDPVESDENHPFQKLGLKLDLQLFAINKDKQVRHVELISGGTHSKDSTRSYLFGDLGAVERLYDEYNGKGTPVANGSNKERVILDHEIGMYYDNDKKKFFPSNVLIIHHGKTGDHIIVGRPQKGVK